MTKRFACARCGRYQAADLMIFSRHTRLHYCRAFTSCDRRFRKQAKGTEA